MARPVGSLNKAALPGPSAKPVAPGVPATVVTAPDVAILRIVLLPASVIYALPLTSATIPTGALKRAAAPVPSAKPAAPAVPARVVTTPSQEILRIVLFAVSATYTLPRESLAVPDGASNHAAPPAPSADPGCGAVPASVLTMAAGVILRTVSFA